MSERDRLDLRGQVRTCRVHRTIYSHRCGADACDTEEQSDIAIVEFRADGSLVRRWHQNPDGSEWTSTYECDDEGRLMSVRIDNGAGVVDRTFHHYDAEGRLVRVIARGRDGDDRQSEAYEYDTAGRKKKTCYIDLPAQNPATHHVWGVEGTDSLYSAPGAATLTTLYNERERPIEVSFRDASGHLLSRVDFSYDRNGNLVEEAQTNTEEALPTERFPDFSEPQLQAVRALLGAAGEPIRRTHRYDEQGWRIESRSGIGRLGATTQAMAYNDHGDRIEEVCHTEEREYGLDDEGRLVESPDKTRVIRSEARIRYNYDIEGNWVMKIVENRSKPDQEFTVCSTEQRVISYFPLA